MTLVAVFSLGTICLHAQRSQADSIQKATQLYQSGRLAEAERSFREIVRRDPTNIAAQMHLGQTLFKEEKFAEAIAPYEKVRAVEKEGTKLTLTQHRILGDQLAMAYGISGHTADSKALLRELARTDPGYPLGNPWVIHRVIQDGNPGQTDSVSERNCFLIEAEVGTGFLDS